MKKITLFLIAACALLVLVAPPFLKNYGIYLLSYWLIFVIATMGLNLTVGYAGQKSLGHAAFFGIGAYTVAIMMKAGLSFWLGLHCVGLSGTACANHLFGVCHAGL
jgi:branched-chain amino acid transport system permease protein